MGRLAISLACTVSDRTRPILDGRVAVEGCDVTGLPGEPEDIFFRALRHGEFDVSELSFSSYLVVSSRGQSPYIGVPVFLSRAFRHSAIYIRTDRGIETPQDLKGRLVGTPEFQQTAALWVRGILADEYGVKASDIRWCQGGLEAPKQGERVPLTLPAEIEYQAVAADKTLSGMLAAGEIDAIVSPRVPSCVAAGTAPVGRLFPDYRAAEETYFRKTGFFPIMHLVGVRRDLAERHPWLAANVFRAFVKAKAMAMQDLAQINALRVTLPWVGDDVARVQAVMGPDYWRYGVNENRAEIEALVRYAAEQHLTARPLTLEELFAAATI